MRVFTNTVKTGDDGFASVNLLRDLSRDVRICERIVTKVYFTRSVRARPDLLSRISLFVFGELLALTAVNPLVLSHSFVLFAAEDIWYLGQFLLPRVLTLQFGEHATSRRHVARDIRRVHVRFNEAANEAVVPDGWPLTLGGNGLILQLGELETSALRLGECYLCVRSAAAATAIATATTSSVSGAGEATERNTVEIAVVWRATSMRAPGILGWDREDEFMDWRDLTNKGQPSSSSAAGTSLGGQSSASAMKISGRPRRRSREDARPRTREANRTGSAEHRREETRSIDRLEHQSCREDRVATEPGSAVMKSRSASSVNAWKEDLDDELERGASRRHAYIKNSSSSPVAGDESRTKVKRCAKVVSSTTMEKWKESSRCETRSRTVAPEDLKSPLQFEESVLRQDNATAGDSPKDLEDRLRHVGGPDDVSDEDLPAYIGNLLVTVERKIERVSLDDMTFPCPACRNIDTDDPLLGCRCAGDDCGCDAGEDNCDCAVAASRKEQSAWSFEVAGIKHIDSDDEEEVRMGFGTKKRVDEVASPRTIHDLPEHILTCGLSLLGYADIAGRPVIEFEDNASTREALSVRETSSFLLYLARLPSSDCTKNGFTIFIRGDSKDDLDFVDKMLVLLQSRIVVAQTLVFRSTAPTDGPADSLLPLSKVQTVIVNDATLAKYIPRREEYHDQMQWIAFYKEYDSLMTEWQSAGRRLALEMSELKECTSLSGTLTPLGRLLTDPTLRRTSRDAEEAIAALEERAAPLLHVEHVRLSMKRARRLVEEVGKAATRLESSFESRRATIRNLAVLRSIEDQAHELLPVRKKINDRKSVLAESIYESPDLTHNSRLGDERDVLSVPGTPWHVKQVQTFALIIAATGLGGPSRSRSPLHAPLKIEGTAGDVPGVSCVALGGASGSRYGVEYPVLDRVQTVLREEFTASSSWRTKAVVCGLSKNSAEPPNKARRREEVAASGVHARKREKRERRRQRGGGREKVVA
ncbi:hypothetical protein DMN91_000498 [Ooceraea biroi]|uniref:Uncharacterized protein n=1 Tax=Ooceraea biroi TaxID=2015173 RepID=A0A3L8E1U7_OOCBI|nr:hypothetical protein DMN91_000498 [Ooceraea biroi]